VHFEALGMQHAMRTRHKAMCGLSGCTRFFHVISSIAPFSKEEKSYKHKMCYEFLYEFCLTHFSFEEELREI